MPYKLLLFDADDTLFDFKKSQDVAFKQAVDQHQLAELYETLEPAYKVINKNIWTEFEQGLIDADSLKVERFRRLFDTCRIQLDAEEFAVTYMECLSNASYVYDGVPELLNELGDKYRMAIITNGLTMVQDRRIRQSSIKGHFEEIVISEEISLVKPDPEIFDYTLKKLGHDERSSVLMIGDSLNSDILGANRAGIDACWLNSAGRENKGPAEPKYEISSILNLNQIL